MKSPQKKMPAKNQNQLDIEYEKSLDESLDVSGEDVIILNPDASGINMDYGAANSTYSISAIDTITLDGNTMWNGSNSSTLSWPQDYSINSWNSDHNVNITKDGITMKHEGDLKIGDRSLKDFMDRVEDQLAILRPVPELEEKWNDLKELRRQYETLKQDILEKEKIMKILKET
jgi:hypothetical protein